MLYLIELYHLPEVVNPFNERFKVYIAHFKMYYINKNKNAK